MSKVLLVDDEEQIRKVLTIFLTRQGFEVVQAPGGEEAIALLTSGQRFDLIITDIKMPKVTGLDVLRAKKGSNDTTPAILLTGCIDVGEYLPFLKELGLDPGDIVTKPIDLPSLLQVIKGRFPKAGDGK